MKKKLGLVFVILLLVSGFNKLILAPSDMDLYSFSTVGFLIAVNSSFLFLYALYTEKKDIYFLANIGIIAGFLVIVINLYAFYNSVQCSFGIGFYLLMLAYFLYFASFFVSDVKEKKVEDNKASGLEQFVNNKNFIRGKYILGIKSDEQLSNSECIIEFDDNKLKIIIVKNQTTFNYEIDVTTIKNVSVNKLVIMNQDNNKVEDHTMENILLMTALFGPIGTAINSSGLLSDGGKDTKVTYRYEFELTFTCELNNQKSNLMFKLYQDPTIMLKNLQNKEQN